MHSSKKAQIAKLKVDEALTKVLSKYANFVDMFSPKLATKLLEYTGTNNYSIELVDDWQLLYGLIHSLAPVELETLKVYIKNNLANGFIRLFKSPAGAPIFFNKSQAVV